MSDLEPFPQADDDGAAAASAASVQEIYAALAPERLGADAEPPPEPTVPEDVLRAQAVDVLLVCHDGERWLPRTLEALGATDLDLRSVVAVDTGSTDGTPQVLADAAVVDEVVTVPADTGFSASLATAVEHARARVGAPDGPAWYWLLHDDSAPHPDALRHLLAGAIEHEAAVVGPKVLSWDRRRQLVEAELAGVAGLSPNTCEGTFYSFPAFRHDKSSMAMADHLARNGVLVRSGSEFGSSGEKHFRIAFTKSAQDLKEGMDRIKTALEKLD